MPARCSRITTAGDGVIDNAKCAIVKACAHDPLVQRAYAECAEGYGFKIDACPPHVLLGAVHAGGQSAVAARQRQHGGAVRGHRHVYTHLRSRRAGKRMTVRDHLPPQARAFFERDRQWCVQRAGEVGPRCAELVGRLLSDRIAERLRAAQGVIALGQRYGAVRLEAACLRALLHDSAHYRIVKTILATGADQRPAGQRGARDAAGVCPRALHAQRAAPPSCFRVRGPDAALSLRSLAHATAEAAARVDRGPCSARRCPRITMKERKNTHDPIPELASQLKQLRLSGILDSLEVRNHQTIEGKLADTEFLAMLFGDEVAGPENKKFGPRLRRAQFRATKTLEQFDFARLPKLNRALVHDLATGRHLQEKAPVLIVGPSGIGKSHWPRRWGTARCIGASMWCSPPARTSPRA